jgi:hypothetical protein
VYALQTSVQQVGELTRLVRGDVSSLARRLLAALITIDVHSRDIVSSLLSKGTSSTEEFEWQMQLRYYWEDDDLVVRQVRHQLGRYGEHMLDCVHGEHMLDCSFGCLAKTSQACAGMHFWDSVVVIMPAALMSWSGRCSCDTTGRLEDDDLVVRQVRHDVGRYGAPTEQQLCARQEPVMSVLIS